MYELNKFIRLFNSVDEPSRSRQCFGMLKKYDPTQQIMHSLIQFLENNNKSKISPRKVMEITQKLGPNGLKKYALPLDYLFRILPNDVPPQNLQWLNQSCFAGMSRFASNPDLYACALNLYKSGVRTIISIESSGAADTKLATAGSLPYVEWYSCFLEDWHAPSVEHLLEYCKLVDSRMKYGGVVTHCWGGTGRTGCFLAAYLIYSKCCINATSAFQTVRKEYSTHSVEMKVQYHALARFSDYLRRPISYDLNSSLFNHAGGHWEKSHENDGFAADPQHMGASGLSHLTASALLASSRSNIKKMVARQGVKDSKAPYITQNPNAKIQRVTDTKKKHLNMPKLISKLF